jgi:hypothetical protein
LQAYGSAERDPVFAGAEVLVAIRAPHAGSSRRTAK